MIHLTWCKPGCPVQVMMVGSFGEISASIANNAGFMMGGKSPLTTAAKKFPPATYKVLPISIGGESFCMPVYPKNQRSGLHLEPEAFGSISCSGMLLPDTMIGIDELNALRMSPLLLDIMFRNRTVPEDVSISA